MRTLLMGAVRANNPARPSLPAVLLPGGAS
jgi:hypothetical protein